MSRENPLETECFGKWRCVQTRQAVGKEKEKEKKNYNSKREDLEEEDQGEDERNEIL